VPSLAIGRPNRAGNRSSAWLFLGVLVFVCVPACRFAPRLGTEHQAGWLIQGDRNCLKCSELTGEMDSLGVMESVIVTLVLWGKRLRRAAAQAAVSACL